MSVLETVVVLHLMSSKHASSARLLVVALTRPNRLGKVIALCGVTYLTGTPTFWTLYMKNISGGLSGIKHKM